MSIDIQLHTLNVLKIKYCNISSVIFKLCTRGTIEIWERHLKLVHNVKGEPLIMTLMVGALIFNETNEMVPFKCKNCEFHATKKKSIAKHFKEVHEVLKYYDCSQCLFTATTTKRLDRHKKKSHPTLKKLVK